MSQTVDNFKQNIKLTLAYDGTDYLGWQKTYMGASIEATLQAVLEQILQEKVSLQAASRTDAGVHAEGQVVNFFTETKREPNQLLLSLNALLPKDIRVLTAEKAPHSFHPTLDCQSKEYHYYLCFGNTQLPYRRLYSWHYPHPLDLIAMKEASQHFLGENDFSSFCNMKKNSHYDNFIRRIDQFEIFELPKKQLVFKIKGNSFLYRMVRNLIGTLVYIGSGKIPQKNLITIIKSQDRTQAGMTAPAHGLCLYRINY